MTGWLINNNIMMKINFIADSDFLTMVPEAILSKQDTIKFKMKKYNDVKVYLYSFIQQEDVSDGFINEMFTKYYNETFLLPYFIAIIVGKGVDNPRIAFKNENGIIHVVLCFEHNKEE